MMPNHVVAGLCVALAVSPPVLASEVPAQLTCLAKHAGLAVVMQDGRPGLRMPDGLFLAWDDGRKKGPDERIDSPDLEDTLSIVYYRGGIKPVDDPSQDPGRARVTALFDALYGRSGPRLPVKSVRLGGGSVQVHEKIAPALERVATRLSALARTDPAVAAAVARPAGGLALRNIAGTTRASAHAWGIAVDIDTRVSDYWRWAGKSPKWRSRIPPAIVEAFEAEGFIWGGRWFHFDTMHFEYRPELLDPACAPASP